MQKVPYVEERVSDAVSILGNLSEAHIEERIWRNRSWQVGTLGPASVPVHTQAQIVAQSEVVHPDTPTELAHKPIEPPVALDG